MDPVYASFEFAPVIKKGDYEYFVHPLCDGVPKIDPILLSMAADKIIFDSFILNVDKIVCVEAMGIPLATALSMKTGIPFVVIRKREYGFENEVKVGYETGYSKNELYINDIGLLDNVFIVDDVISTGETLINIIREIRKIGAEITGVMTLVCKDHEVIDKINAETGVLVDCLYELKIFDGKVEAYEM